MITFIFYPNGKMEEPIDVLLAELNEAVIMEDYEKASEIQKEIDTFRQDFILIKEPFKRKPIPPLE